MCLLKWLHNLRNIDVLCSDGWKRIRKACAFVAPMAQRLKKQTLLVLLFLQWTLGADRKRLADRR